MLIPFFLYSHFSKTILLNLHTNVRGITIPRKSPGVFFFAERFKLIFHVRLNINTIENIFLFPSQNLILETTKNYFMNL